MRSSDFPDLEAMRQGINYRFPVACRGKSWQLRPLSSIEIIQSASETSDRLSKLPEGQQNGITTSLLNAMYQLEKASSEDVGQPGNLTVVMLERMTPDEVNHIWKQYVRITDKVNPDIEDVPAEELENIVEGLKKNSDPVSLLTDLSISRLVAVCLRLLRPTEA